MDENIAPELALPARRSGSFENVEVKRLAAQVQRSLDEIERWANAPHRTYGSRMVSPFYVFEDNTVDKNTTIKARGSGTYGAGIFEAGTLDIDRRSLAIIWASGEFANTSGTTEYTLYPFAVVDDGVAADNGQSLRQHMPNDSKYRNWHCERKVFLDPPAIPTTYTFSWAFVQSDGSDRPSNVGHQRMVVGIFDAPDIPTEANGGAEVAWTRSVTNKHAYRNQETGTDFS